MHDRVEPSVIPGHPLDHLVDLVHIGHVGGVAVPVDEDDLLGASRRATVAPMPGPAPVTGATRSAGIISIETKLN